MYFNALLEMTIHPPEMTHSEDVEINSSIAEIELLLLKIARRQRWIDYGGNVIVTNDYVHIGSNIITTDLSSLIITDDGVPTFEPDIYKRFVDNEDSRPESLMKDISRLLRVRFGDNIINHYVSRLAKAYLPIDVISEMEFDLESTDTGALPMFFSHWWVICAFQLTLIGYEYQLSLSQ